MSKVQSKVQSISKSSPVFTICRCKCAKYIDNFFAAENTINNVRKYFDDLFKRKRESRMFITKHF